MAEPRGAPSEPPLESLDTELEAPAEQDWGWSPLGKGWMSMPSVQREGVHGYVCFTTTVAETVSCPDIQSPLSLQGIFNCSYVTVHRTKKNILPSLFCNECVVM